MKNGEQKKRSARLARRSDEPKRFVAVFVSSCGPSRWVERESKRAVQGRGASRARRPRCTGLRGSERVQWQSTVLLDSSAARQDLQRPFRRPDLPLPCQRNQSPGLPVPSSPSRPVHLLHLHLTTLLVPPNPRDRERRNRRSRGRGKGRKRRRGLLSGLKEVARTIRRRSRDRGS